jgi:hypothetical protein
METRPGFLQYLGKRNEREVLSTVARDQIPMNDPDLLQRWAETAAELGLDPDEEAKPAGKLSTPSEEDSPGEASEPSSAEAKKSRRRRRSRSTTKTRGEDADATPEGSESAPAEEPASGGRGKKRRRQNSRGGRGSKESSAEGENLPTEDHLAESVQAREEVADGWDELDLEETEASVHEPGAEQEGDEAALSPTEAGTDKEEEEQPRKRKRRRRKKTSREEETPEEQEADTGESRLAEEEEEEEAPSPWNVPSWSELVASLYRPDH